MRKKLPFPQYKLLQVRNLRKDQTDVEKLLWYKLRGRQLNGAKFRRQQAIGNYIVDFFCFEQMLVIELDGSQHAENMAYDSKRTEYLVSKGYKVLRFWDSEVIQNMDGVLETILLNLKSVPHPDPLPKGEGNMNANLPSRKKEM